MRRLILSAALAATVLLSPGCGKSTNSGDAPAKDKSKPAADAAPPARAPEFEVSRPKGYIEDATQTLGTLPDGVGLPVGSKAPEFTASTADGKPVTLAQLTVKGPILLTFYRGGW